MQYSVSKINLERFFYYTPLAQFLVGFQSLGSEPRECRDDFIVKVGDGVPNDPLNLVIEVKRYRNEATLAKANAMKAFWVPGVNSQKTLAIRLC